MFAQRSTRLVFSLIQYLAVSKSLLHPFPLILASGHVFCQNCCKNIIEKTSPRLSPACPFCREPFQSDSIRLIRIDCPPNRWTTKRFKALAPGVPYHNNASHYDDRLFLKPSKMSREEIRHLEDKVAKVALKKCSVEEVSTLHNELTQCLMSDVKHDDQVRLLSCFCVSHTFLTQLAALLFITQCCAATSHPY